MSRQPESFAKPQIVPTPKPVLDLSFVIPAYNEAGNITKTVAQVDAHARRVVSSFEIVIVDDGSLDATFEESQALCAQYPLRVLRLSRNFGKEQAIMAGLERSIGAAVVILDADLQEPLSHLETATAGWDMAPTAFRPRILCTAECRWRHRDTSECPRFQAHGSTGRRCAMCFA